REDDPVARGKLKRNIGGEPGKRVVQRSTALPYLLAAFLGHVVHPDRPGLRQQRDDGLLHLLANNSDECDLATIRRPARELIAVGAGREIFQFAASEFINRDEAVVAAVTHERDLLAVRRPFGLLIVSARVSQRFGLFFPRNGSNPELFLGRPDGELTTRRNLD